MNTEITMLKEDIKVYEAQVKLYQSWLNNAKKQLQALQKQVDNTVVDGLRMKVREFIEVYHSAQLPIALLRLNTKNLNWSKEHRPERTPYLQGVSKEGYYVTNSVCSLTEEEAIFLSSQAGRQAYNIDCSVWDTYRYPGEID